MSEQQNDPGRLSSGFHYRGYLPHLKADDGIYFVTFRLAGTLPQSVLEAYQAEREVLLEQLHTLSAAERRLREKQVEAAFSERIDAYLDAGHGECWLNRPEIADLVGGAIRYFEGERYVLYTWVVMPNHVHAVVQPTPANPLSRVLHGWKSYTAQKANQILNRRGLFWQPESYDHLIRDDEDLNRCCYYTIENPVKARLCPRPEDWPYGSAAAP